VAKWSIPLQEMADQAKLDLETTARTLMLSLFQRVIDSSPVGNPDTWKSNSHRVFARKHSNALAALANARLVDDPASYTRTGKVKVKLQKIRSARALSKAFPNVAGKGYVGGTFRANWTAGIGAIDRVTVESTDKSRSEREAQRAVGAELGGVIYFTNSLPYAVRLENGWSQQAPAGMVKLAMASVPRATREAMKK
jgi:hypothetical protein